jgi:uncharacterized RDD family membrane protein YckC
MKCPTCGYLGFEQAERCRNCGYEFAVAAARRPEPELSLRDPDMPSLDDLDLVDGASASSSRPRTPAPSSKTSTPPEPNIEELEELPLFTDKAALLPKASPPRTPLSVRRTRPETPRSKPEAPSVPPATAHEPELEMPLDAPISPAVRAHAPEWAPLADAVSVSAGLGPRAVAAAIDLGLLALVDLSVVYLTMQVCGLSPGELRLLPLGPLLAFLLIQNAGYVVAFTAGGQTIGKMVTGLRVVTTEPGQVLDLGRALQRTLVWVLLALPLGLGLLSVLLTQDRRGLHDRVAGTRVVRAATS